MAPNAVYCIQEYNEIREIGALERIIKMIDTG